MHFEISHTTEYNYSDEVFFEPHYFRFKPKSTSHMVLKDFNIQIEPEPSGLSEQTDAENNHNVFCWFDGTHQQLKIKSQSTVESQEYSPFNFLVHPSEYLRLPFEYKNKTKELLNPSLNSADISESMYCYIKAMQREYNYQSVDFLLGLTQKIHRDFNLKLRESGDPHQPDFTFKKKTGSCRDLAWMQIHMLRKLGIASRFVSGYYYVEVENPDFELHAWTEAFLPGAGWIGLDPSHGILTNVYHIPVASSAFYENTMPVSGTVRGDAKSELKNELFISLVP